MSEKPTSRSDRDGRREKSEGEIDSRELHPACRLVKFDSLPILSGNSVNLRFDVYVRLDVSSF